MHLYWMNAGAPSVLVLCARVSAFDSYRPQAGKSWFDGVSETTEMMGLVATMTKKFTCLYSVAL